VQDGGVARNLIPKQTGPRLDLERYLRYYNTERATLAGSPRDEQLPMFSERKLCTRIADASPQLRDRII
jgi:hypothetical protein